MTARRAAILTALAGPAAIFVGDLLLGPIGAVAIVVAGVVIGWKYVPGFWRTLVRAAIAGGLAGVLILGPGYRLAMRVVAILDDATTPEFTIEGTAFLVIGIGAIFGAAITAFVTIVTRTFAVRRRVAVAALTTVAVTTFFLDSEIFRELTELGMGPLMNVPMFLGVTVAWAWLADGWARPSHDIDTVDPELVRVAS